MDLPLASEQRSKVEQFRRKHRTALLTLLFTDLVGSTKLKQDLGDSKAVTLIQNHHALVRELLARFPEAEEIGTAGDSFFIVFLRPSDAVRFSLLLQSRLRPFANENAHPLLDRVGIHIGEVVVEEREDSLKPKDLYGIQVDTCARVMSLAQGDQILLTRSAFDNARQVLKGEELEEVGMLSWLNHGPYVLKGIDDTLEICEVGENEKAVLKPPPDSEKVHRHISPDSEPVLGWRPALDQLVPNTKWILETKLGEGGFGEVWLGRHETLKERRVFKFCFRADRVRSLKREVTIFRMLKERFGEHPNIVAVRDVFFDQPPYYIVMDYVDGGDLRSWCAVQGGCEKIPLTTRLELIAQVADALQAAHDAGVRHRDVKPSNILISRLPGKESSLAAKLTDFGIGKIMAEEVLADVTGFTETMKSQAGTPMYMAPELLTGRRISDEAANDALADTKFLCSVGNEATPQSDIYSLGVVLYQLLVGDFTCPLTMDWGRHVSEPLLREDLDRCFAGEPGERFGSAAELAARLRAFEDRRLALVREKAEQERRERAAYRRGVLRTAALAACVVAVVAGLAIYAVTQARRASREKARAEANLVKAREAVEKYLSDITKNEKLNQADFHNLRKELLETAIPFYEGFLATGGDDPNLRADQAIALGRLAIIRNELGQTAEAEQSNRRELAVWEKIVAEFPSVPAYRSSLAASHNNLGNLLQTTGRSKEAEEAYQRAVTVQEKLVTDFPSVPEYRRDLAISHLCLGTVLQRTGQSKEAEHAYRRALAVSEKFVADFPSVPAYWVDLALNYYDLGDLLQNKGQSKEAEEAYQRAVAVCEKLVADFPSVPEYRSSLARNHIALGTLLQATGRAKEAEQAYQRALVLQEKLVADFPSVPEHRLSLASSYNNLGTLLEEAGQSKEAEQAYQRASLVKEKLVAEFPSVPNYRSDLAVSHSNLGILLQKIGRTKEAEEAYQRALAVCEKLAAEFPTVPEYRSAVARTHHKLGIFFRETGRSKKAEEAYQRSSAVMEQLAAEFPSVPQYRRELAKCHSNLGLLLQETGRSKEAEQEYQRGLAALEKLAAEFPSVPKYRSDLADSHNNFGNLLIATRRVKEAEEAYQRALTVREKLVADFPSVPEYRSGLASSHNNLGILLQDTGRDKEAEQAYERALAAWEKLVTEFQNVPYYQSEFDRTLYHLARLFSAQKRLDEARLFYERTIALQRPVLESHPENPSYRRILRDCYWGVADTASNRGDHKAAAAAANELLKLYPESWEEYHRAAGFIAGCVPVVAKDEKLTTEERKQLGDAYGTQAVELLRQAIAKGYKDGAKLPTQEDFAAIRDRPDFQKLVSELSNPTNTSGK